MTITTITNAYGESGRHWPLPGYLHRLLLVRCLLQCQIPFCCWHSHYYARIHIRHTQLQRDTFADHVATAETVDPFSFLFIREFWPSETEFSVCRLVSAFLSLPEYRIGEILSRFHTNIDYLSLKNSQPDYLDSMD